MKIWKYGLAIVDEQVLSIPKVIGFLDVQVQHNQACLWVQVDENAPLEQYKIRIIGTGNSMPENPGIHLGTFQMHGGALVLHAFAEFHQ